MHPPCTQASGHVYSLSLCLRLGQHQDDQEGYGGSASHDLGADLAPGSCGVPKLRGKRVCWRLSNDWGSRLDPQLQLWVRSICWASQRLLLIVVLELLEPRHPCSALLRSSRLP